MSEAELKKRIAFLDQLLPRAGELKLMEDVVQSQVKRRAELQDQLDKTTSCHCGDGVPIEVHTPHGDLLGMECKCNKQNFITSCSI